MRPTLSRLATPIFIACCAALVVFSASARAEDPPAAAQDAAATPGALEVLDPDGRPRGACPLKHTGVRAEISGFLSRVTVTQEFENPFKEKIEAVYTFPLPASAAVDDMTMTVGDRVVRGRVLRREQAQAVYEAARSGGQVAGLLDQERPNVFTQSVANIMPGERVTVTISYVEMLKYEEGNYEFSFPMVVGPRYVPGEATGQAPQGGGFAPDTDEVPDASRVTPRVAPAGTRAGHDISVEVALDAGVPVGSLRSTTHDIESRRESESSAVVRLKNRGEIPNKDFVLRYAVGGRRLTDALLTHRTERGGFFTLILQPPDRVTVEDVTPKELVFVLDTSGSMSGFPIEKAKEAMKHAIDGLNPQDTFNLITFAGDTRILFPTPVPATRANLARAQQFLAASSGSGGTEMMKAIRAALAPSNSQAHVRVVCFMTDGYVGNDFEIISEVQKHPNARVFSFGIGSSVNRFLLDRMAEAGRGEVEYVGLGDDGSAAARRFHERVRNPLLTDISIDWGGLPVADLYPRRVPDLFSAKPVVINGRYERGGRGVVRLKGRMSGNYFEREIPVELPESESEHDVLATLWARTRVDDLMSRDYEGVQRGQAPADIKETITQLGIEYRLMTQFTSFVAVEEMTITDGGKPRRVEVPVELPEGVSREGVFGEKEEAKNAPASAMNMSASPVRYRAQLGGKRGGNVGGAGGGGGGPVVSSGVLNNKAVSLPKPSYPAMARAAQTSGSVSVQITVDEGGNVVAASAPSGHPLLQAAAVEAARKAKFSPTMLSGKPVRTSGVIVYNFDAGGTSPAAAAVQLDGDAGGGTLLAPAEQRRQLLLGKLHQSVMALVERLDNKSDTPGADEAKFVSGGRAELQVWLSEKSPEVLEELKKLGFEVVLDPRTAKMVIGRLPIDKLAALAQLKAVRYVAPQTTGGP